MSGADTIARLSIVVVGMWGLGDNLHQRAPLRELLKIYDVWLETCHAELYHDLIADGLKLIFKSTNLRAQARTIDRERGLFHFPPPPPDAIRIKLWYHKAEIDKYGSISQAMFPPFQLPVPERPDFSLPVKPAWTAAARKLIDQWRPKKPLMMFRPIVLRREWDGAARNPDPAAYAAIFNAIRNSFFVVSIADLEPNKEWIIGTDLPADVKLHNAQVDFTTMAGLWKEADMFFGNAGFGPVLAQAVGTPAIVVYGGRESFLTTERAGAHLAPTLGINPIRPCDCHAHNHRCDKRIDVPQAIESAKEFVTDFVHGGVRPADAPLVRLNFGCGTNHLPGWRNMDIEVNIEKPLPFEEASADAVFAEHCVEHTDYYSAIRFFEEAYRVLRPGGAIRITVPSIEQVWKLSEPDYWKFTEKWQKQGPTKRGAMYAMLFAHGHQTAWTASLLLTTLAYAGFEALKQQSPGLSDFAVLRGLEGHGKVIGEKFNSIESLCVEGRKPDALQRTESPKADVVAEPQRSVTSRVESPQANAPRAAARTLIFATTYVDGPERQELTLQWLQLHTALNPECDFLLVDSASPMTLLSPDWQARFNAEPQKFKIFNFGDNIGHLSRRGRDGWGRAFCYGLDYAVRLGYQHVVHVEGDSLLRIPVAKLIEKLVEGGDKAASIPVKGTTAPVPLWIETGLMAFSTKYLRDSALTRRYDWRVRTQKPSPELVLAQQIGHDLTKLGIKGMRNDTDAITYKNILSMDLDWVTHCHRDVWAYREFMNAALQPESIVQPVAASMRANPEQTVNVPAIVGHLTVPPIAVVVGGAKQVREEIALTDEMIAKVGGKARYFVINDMIPLFERECTAVTLHPAKLSRWRDNAIDRRGWLKEREDNGFPKPDEVWAHVTNVNFPAVTNSTDDWRGSSGLFAVAVAMRLNFRRIILCGVPMQADAGHVVRHEQWNSATQFMPGWRTRQTFIAPFVRSWSGWTGDTFGLPDVEFILRGP